MSWERGTTGAHIYTHRHTHPSGVATTEHFCSSLQETYYCSSAKAKAPNGSNCVYLQPCLVHRHLSPVKSGDRPLLSQKQGAFALLPAQLQTDGHSTRSQIMPKQKLNLAEALTHNFLS